MTTERMLGGFTRTEWLIFLGIANADDPKLAALAATTWGGNALKVLQVNATENGWQFAAIVGLTDGDKGDVTVSSSGTVWTIDNGAVTFAKLQDIATDRLIGRDTAGSGDPEEISVSGGLEWTGSGGIQTSAFTGDVTKSAGGTALAIANDAVTYAKFQNVSATDRLLGRSTSGAGDVEEIACTAAGRAILDDADAAAQRTTLGLGTIATQASSSVSITGGSISGLSSLSVAGSITMAIGSGGVLTAFESDSGRQNRAIVGADGTGAYVQGTFGSGGTGDVRIVNISTTIATFTSSGANLASGKTLLVNGTQVVTARQAAVADATGSGDVVAQLNALLARLRTHGLIAT